MVDLPKSSEELDISYSEAYEHIRCLESHSVSRIYDTAFFFREMDEKEVFTYRHNDELATVRKSEDGIILEGAEDAKSALSFLEPSQSR